MPTDSFNPDDENDNVEGFGSGVSSTGAGVPKTSYASTGGTTPVGSSPGFVNLGQMLALNKSSGAQSANALNQSVSRQGASAENNVNNALNTFKSQADVASNPFNANANLAEAKKGAAFTGYQGPKELDDIGNLKEGQEESDRNSGMNMTKVRDDVAAAQGRANALGTFGGVSAEAGKAQSLSPRQSAASAFYMGASNPNFKATSDKFKGLGDMLTNASKQAQMYGKNAVTQADANTRNYVGLAAKRQNSFDEAQQAERTRQAQADSARRLTEQTARDTAFNHANRTGAQGVSQIDDATLAGQHGRTYQQWVDEGMPSADEMDYTDSQRNRKGNSTQGSGY